MSLPNLDDKKRRRLQWIAAIAVIILTGVINIYSNAHAMDTDVFWHYVVGRDTLENGPINADTYYTWQTDAGIWNQHEWLFDVFLYGVFHLLGVAGQIVLYGLATMGLIVLGWALSKPRNPFLYAVVAMILQLCFCFVRCNRPITYSVYLLMIIAWIYKSKQSQIRKCIEIGLLTILLVNMHGGMIITELAILFLLPVLSILADLLNHEPITKRRLLTWGSGFSCCIIALLCSAMCPDGIHMTWSAFQVGSVESTKYIQEWKPLSMSLIHGVLVGLIFLSFGYVLRRTTDNSDKKIWDKDIIENVGLCSAFLILSLHSMKAFAVAYTLFLLLGYRYIEQLIYDVTSEKVQNFFAHFYDVAIFVAGFTAAVICYDAIPDLSNIGSMNEWVASRTSMPIIEELKRLESESEDPVRIGHGYCYGNYMIWNDIPCFVDSRQFMYDQDLTDGQNRSVNDLFDVEFSRNPDTVKEFLDTYDFDYIVTNKEFDINWYLMHDENWNIVMQDTISYEDTTETFTLWKAN